MKPIVSPWIFYWLSVIDGLKGLFVGGVIFSITAIAIMVVIIGVKAEDMQFEEDDEDDKRLMEKLKKWIKMAIIIIIISLFGSILIPSKETLEKMIITSYITPANIEAGKEEVKELIDYIFEKVDGGDQNRR